MEGLGAFHHFPSRQGMLRDRKRMGRRDGLFRDERRQLFEWPAVDKAALRMGANKISNLLVLGVEEPGAGLRSSRGPRRRSFFAERRKVFSRTDGTGVFQIRRGAMAVKLGGR